MCHRNNRAIYLGLDYHSRSVQVSVVEAGGEELLNRSCRNDIEAIVTLCAGLGQVRGVAIEACPGAADFAHGLIERTGWSTDLAHPGYVARMKQSPDKTDRSDAHVLADLSRVGYLPRVWLAPTYIRELRVLDSLRDSIAADIRRVKQHVRAVLREQRVAVPSFAAGAWTRKWMSWVRRDAPLSESGRFVVAMELEQLATLCGRRSQVEQRMREHTLADPVVAALKEEPGIGEVIAWKIRSRIGRFDRFRTGRQLSRFCGLSPRNASSGQRQSDSGLIRACDSSLRAMLLQAAHQLRLRDDRWRRFANDLIRRGVHRNIAIAALANRWMRGLYQRMKEISATG